jgi:hypothetical protein
MGPSPHLSCLAHREYFGAMAQRVVEHAVVGLLTGAVVAGFLRLLRIRIAAGWAEFSLVGACAAIAFTLVDGRPTGFAWSVGVAAAAAILYGIALVAVSAAVYRRRPTSER